MKRFLTCICVGLLVSLVLTSLNVSVNAQDDDLTESTIHWLNIGESFRIGTYLFENEPISSACSQDCYDIDLTLYDANTKKSVAQDHDNTSTPMVNAPYEGDFIVEVEMANCARSGGCRTWIREEEEDS